MKTPEELFSEALNSNGTHTLKQACIMAMKKYAKQSVEKFAGEYSKCENFIDRMECLERTYKNISDQ